MFSCDNHRWCRQCKPEFVSKLSSKISATLMGHKLSEETKRKISLSMKGRKHTPEHIAAHAGKCPEGCICKRHLPPWNKGLSASVETCKKISETLRSNQQSSWNKGLTAKYDTRIAEMSRKSGNSHRGRKHSEEHKRKNAEGVARARANGAYNTKPNKLELSLYCLLSQAGFEFDTEKRFGRYIADVYDPENGLIWEADGSYWHQDQEKELIRDTYLLDRGIAAVIHLSEKDLAVVQAGFEGLGQ